MEEVVVVVEIELQSEGYAIPGRAASLWFCLLVEGLVKRLWRAPCGVGLGWTTPEQPIPRSLERPANPGCLRRREILFRHFRRSSACWDYIQSASSTFGLFSWLWTPPRILASFQKLKVLLPLPSLTHSCPVGSIFASVS